MHVFRTCVMSFMTYGIMGQLALQNTKNKLTVSKTVISTVQYITYFVFVPASNVAILVGSVLMFLGSNRTSKVMDSSSLLEMLFLAWHRYVPASPCLTGSNTNSSPNL